MHRHWIIVNDKLKVSLFLCLNWAPRRAGGVEVSLHAFLTSALDGDEWSASRPCRFTPRGRAPGIQWIGVWVGPWTGLDPVVYRQIPGNRTPYPVNDELERMWKETFQEYFRIFIQNLLGELSITTKGWGNLCPGWESDSGPPDC